MAAQNDTQIGLSRLENWVLWSKRGEVAIVMSHYYPRRAAVCGNHIPDAGDVWESDAPVPVDEKDAVEVERLVLALPRHDRNIIMHFYFGRPKHMGISEDVLRIWLESAARKLVDA